MQHLPRCSCLWMKPSYTFLLSAQIICTPSCPPQALSGSERKIRTKRESLEQLFGKIASYSYSNPNSFNRQCLDFSAVLAFHWFTGLRHLSRRSNRKGPVGSDPPSPPTIKRTMLSSQVSNIIIATWDGPIANAESISAREWFSIHISTFSDKQYIGDTKIYHIH